MVKKAYGIKGNEGNKRVLSEKDITKQVGLCADYAVAEELQPLYIYGHIIFTFESKRD